MERVIATVQFGLVQQPEDILATDDPKYQLDKQDWVSKMVKFDHSRLQVINKFLKKNIETLEEG